MSILPHDIREFINKLISNTDFNAALSNLNSQEVKFIAESIYNLLYGKYIHLTSQEKAKLQQFTCTYLKIAKTKSIKDINNIIIQHSEAIKEALIAISKY